MATMKAVVYHGPGKKSLDTVPKPQIVKPTDAIVKITHTTICGTDLHILKGDVPACKPGTILGHEGVGIVDEVGSAVSNFKKGDKVIVSCITACGKCDFCKKHMYSHCEDGGWIMGHLVNGTQAEYCLVRHADNSMYKVPEGLKEEAMTMISDIFPTGFEIGVLNSKVSPGCSVCIIGAGPVGLAALMTAQFYSPGIVIMVDFDDNRLDFSLKHGATHVVNPKNGDGIKKIMEIVGGKGVDCAIEAVGIPATFEMCEEIIAPGGIIANVGVHGKKVDLQLQKLWISNIAITTGLVDAYTSQMLIKTCVAKKLKPEELITHRFKFDEFEKAYEIFSKAAENNALKVIITNP